MICCSMHAKSTKNRPIECCRRNLCPPNRRPRKWCHSIRSASVWLRRSSRARNLLLPLTPALSPHRRGEGDYTRGPRQELDQLDYAVGESIYAICTTAKAAPTLAARLSSPARVSSSL